MMGILYGRIVLVILWICISPLTITVALWQDNWQDIKEGYQDAFNYPFNNNNNKKP